MSVRIGKRRIFSNLKPKAEEGTSKAPAVLIGGMKELEPKNEHFLSLDWRVPFKELPLQAQSLILRIAESCHPSTMQVFLRIFHKREMQDYQLWSMLEETKRLLNLGDQIYTKRRR